MALSKDKKTAVVAELTELLGSSKLTVVAQYKGMTVKSIQGLRKAGRENGTQFKVVKNRLVQKALLSNETLKDVDTTSLKGQLLYAFNATDETASAQVIKKYMKEDSALEFVGAITAEGTFMSAADVTALASLPSKQQLIAGIINTLNSPMRDVMSGLGGNLHGLLKAIETKTA